MLMGPLFLILRHSFVFVSQRIISYSYNPDANMGTVGFNGLPA